MSEKNIHFYKLLFIIPLLIMSTLINAQKKKENLPEYTKENKYGKYTLQSSIGQFISKSKKFKLNIQYNKKSNAFQIRMIGKTKGWLAIGFNPTSDMKDAEIILGYIKDGKTHLTPHFATSYYSHEPIEKLLKLKKPVKMSVLKSEETDELTSITFLRPINIHNKYLKTLRRGVEVKLIYAIAEKDSDIIRHFERGYITIKLP